MIDREKTIQEALEYSSRGNFQVQASYNGFVPDNDVRSYEEKAWYIVKGADIEKYDMAYNMILMNGVPEEDITPEELMRYIASDADTDYDTLSIEKVLLFDLR